MLLPVATYREAEVRRAGVPGVALWVAPTAGVLADHCGEPLGPSRGHGACVTTTHGAFLATRCFTLAEIRAGRAVTLADPRDLVVGLVADGVRAVDVRDRDRDRTVQAVVADNAFVATVPGARRGTRLELRLRRGAASPKDEGWTGYAPLDEDDGYEPPPEHRGGGQ